MAIVVNAYLTHCGVTLKAPGIGKTHIKTEVQNDSEVLAAVLEYAKAEYFDLAKVKEVAAGPGFGRWFVIG